MWKRSQRPDLTFSDKLPDGRKYTCPKGCGCDELVAWRINEELKSYQTYCRGKGKKVHYVKIDLPQEKKVQITETNKPLRILYKLVIGLIYTDYERRPRHELAKAAEQYCLMLDEVIDGDKFIENCINAGIITLETQINGVLWFRHNLPRTIF